MAFRLAVWLLFCALALVAAQATPTTPSIDAAPNADNFPVLPSAVVANIARCMTIDDLRSTAAAVKLHVCDPTVTAAVFVNTHAGKAIEALLDANVTDLRAYQHAMALHPQTQRGRVRAAGIAACNNDCDFLHRLMRPQELQDGFVLMDLISVASQGAALCGNRDAVAWIELDLAELSFDNQQEMFVAAAKGGQLDFIEWMVRVRHWRAPRYRIGEMLVEAILHRRRLVWLYILDGHLGDTPNEQGYRNAFIAACEAGVSELLARINMKVQLTEDDFTSAAWKAARNGHTYPLMAIHRRHRFNCFQVRDLYEVAARNGHIAVPRLLFRLYRHILSTTPTNAVFLAAANGHYYTTKLLFEHARPWQTVINGALGEALGRGYDQIAQYLLHEAPKPAHGPERHRSMVPFKRYVNGWAMGVQVALNLNATDRAVSILERYMPNQREKDDIFAHASDVAARHWLLRHGLLPSQRGIDAALINCNSMGMVTDLFEHAGYAFRPTRAAIDKAFGAMRTGRDCVAAAMYAYGLFPSELQMIKLVMDYLRDYPVDVDLIIQHDRERLRLVAEEIVWDMVDDEYQMSILMLLRQRL